MAETGKSSPWLWISLGLSIGLFVAFILFLDQKIVKNKHQEKESPQQPGVSGKPVFDFYEVLRERKVDIPDTPTEQPDVLNKTKQGKQVKGKFWLQAGSFQKMQDADRRKAELAMLGLEGVIQSAQVNGSIYHRVVLGPYEDGGFYSRVEKRLIKNDIAFLRRSVK